MTDTRLIERWLPIAALGEESVRERRSMTALPPTYYLHVWWARRPLVASRAAVLASVLPADTDRAKFMHALGIHGDPVASRRRIDMARRQGSRFEGQAYTYPRAFTHVPTERDREFVAAELSRVSRPSPVVLDPTAGGGSIPFEAMRLGFTTMANELNPVASLIERATIEYPLKYGSALVDEFTRLATKFLERREAAMKQYFPPEPEPDAISTNFLWARTIRCPYCEGLVPLSPNWRLAPDGTGVRLHPCVDGGLACYQRVCTFVIVHSITEQSAGTIADGDATCPYPDCGRVITGDEIKRQALAGEMGEQLYAVVFKRRIQTTTKSGKRGRDKWERGYRAACPSDDNTDTIRHLLEEKLIECAAHNLIPNELLPMQTESWTHGNTPAQFGAEQFRDLFNCRQLLCHGTSVEIFQELLREESIPEGCSPITRAAVIYLAIAIDKFVDYNSRQVTWHSKREVMAHSFTSHAFPLKWSYAEMSPLIVGSDDDWIVAQTRKCIKELLALLGSMYSQFKDLLSIEANDFTTPAITITCQSGDMLDSIDSESIDVVVIDPPYYDNVMYAELSDFFYVWLKRTAGYVAPELFTRQLTDKENEAVANIAKFGRQKGAKVLAGRDYQERMRRIFEEARRVLKRDGIMTLMFTHKATGAWDALTKGLMEAGFTITASWPINTEAEESLHIKNKSAANSTILLVCRPRGINGQDGSSDYWEDIEPSVAAAVRSHVKDFQQAGITGVDLYLASFGPALEEFSRHWPLKRGTPRQKPEVLRKRRQADLFEEEWNPYAVTPEDALDAARREVKRWRLEQLTHMKASDELDPLTSFFVLAWDAFRAPIFPYDEALRLARAVGVDLDRQVVGVLVEKKGSDLRLWDSAHRAAKGALGPPEGSRGMIDALHHAAHLGRTRTLQAAREMLSKTGVDSETMFFAALEAVLEVLPVGKAFSGIDLDGDLAAAGSDFEALENLRRFAFTERVDPPKQLELWLEPEPA
jgi:adenine-specific DNA methylase